MQNPLLSLEGDVAATRQIIDEQPGPVLLVGHSYGGAVITEAGTRRWLRWATSRPTPVGDAIWRIGTAASVTASPSEIGSGFQLPGQIALAGRWPRWLAVGGR